MKKCGFIIIGFSLTLLACNKKADSGNKGVIKTETNSSEVTDTSGNIDSTSISETKVDGKVTDREESFLYSGLEKSKAKVIFIDKDKTHTITIQANNKTFILDKKEEKEGTTTYERSGIKAEVKGDSLFIIQGDNIIPLGKVKM